VEKTSKLQNIAQGKNKSKAHMQAHIANTLNQKTKKRKKESEGGREKKEEREEEKERRIKERRKEGLGGKR